MRRNYLKSQLGQTLPVLFETEENGLWQGHSDNYCVVRAEGGGHGIMKNVKILSGNRQNLIGIIV